MKYVIITILAIVFSVVLVSILSGCETIPGDYNIYYNRYTPTPVYRPLNTMNVITIETRPNYNLYRNHHFNNYIGYHTNYFRPRDYPNYHHYQYRHNRPIYNNFHFNRGRH